MPIKFMTNLSSGCTQYSQVSFEATLSSKQQNHAILMERHLYISFWYTRGAGSWSKCRLDSFECKFKKEWTICMRAKLPQSCLTLCDPMGCNPPVSSDHGILQARILEWGAIKSRNQELPRILSSLTQSCSSQVFLFLLVTSSFGFFSLYVTSKPYFSFGPI